MRILYIIGNGFDRGLGLDTSYRDYIKYLKGELTEYVSPTRPGVSEIERIATQWILTAVESHQQEFWSDAEVAFGELDFSSMADITGWSIEDVVKYVHRRFIGSMQRWLQKEESKIVKLSANTKCLSISFVNSLTTGWQQGYRGALLNEYWNEISGRELKIDFITFNYTSSLERILANYPSGEVEHHYLTHDYKVKIGDVCHVHGRCHNESDPVQLVFGVNDEKQIKDIKANKSEEVLARMIKSEYEGYVGAGEKSRANNLIVNADWIVLFGLSFGSTDKEWWDVLGRNLRTGGKKLVICPYLTDPQALEESKDLVRYKFTMVRNVFKSVAPSDLRVMQKGSVMARVFVPSPDMIDCVNGEKRRCDYLNLHWVGGCLGIQ